nr:MAG TPA: hypothetical protein [Caudoviricetes sp.]
MIDLLSRPSQSLSSDNLLSCHTSLYISDNSSARHWRSFRLLRCSASCEDAE